ncbi:hypothetical protein OH77DRAFT_1526046 [Trametes cingulata]|nr:hypothetical protein OH77DRAFT_1526046 [Trametes cingulata]
MSARKPEPSTSSHPMKKTILIFHCEFSTLREPQHSPTLQGQGDEQPLVPQGSLSGGVHLEGGYLQYYSYYSATRSAVLAASPLRMWYVLMDDPHYTASRKEDLDQFRRTKSYACACGEGKMLSMTSVAQQVQGVQPKRNTVPGGGPNSLFAAADAAHEERRAA